MGNTVLTGVQVTDPSAGTATCPTTTLVPGQSEVCTVPDHTITAADVAAGKVTNVATASGVQGKHAVVTPQESATIPIPASSPASTASTGLSNLRLLLGGAGALLLLGLVLVFGARRRRRA